MRHAQGMRAAKEEEGISEDWLSLWLGLLVFVISLGVFQGNDLLGWGAKMGVWVDPSNAISVASSAFVPQKGTVVKVEGQKVTIKKSDGKESVVVALGRRLQAQGRRYV